jgi:beta-xylosidase
MGHTSMITIVGLLTLSLACYISAVSVTFSNVLPRLDVNGHPMDIHDGNVMQYNSSGLYYYYGIGYGECHCELDYGCAGLFLLGDCGFRTNHTINLYTSPDLSRWTFVRDILPWNEGRPVGIYYRPKVIYNRLTKLYVLWVNRVQRSGPFGEPNFLDATYVVATSQTPDGQFTVVNTKVQTLEYGNPGDFALFVDDNDNEKSTAYIAYNSFDNLHRIQIEQLTFNYTETLGKEATTGPLTPINNEAPILFKRYGYYYLLFGECCCLCRSGSNSRVFVSTHPLGPWNDTEYDIDPVTEVVINGTIRIRSISGGQESFVVQALQSNLTRALIFVSDRWGTGRYMADDKQYWQPLQFDDTQVPPRIQQLHWTDQFTLDLAVPMTKT